ncbi:MAG TPA: metallophosphoesterase [Oligoflexus sp.]|uniref:metallophosphoesterase family protein n=1 Tax=Oligoflexus sp. TaxID=1971216 RepID=UPI002D7E34D3|nr:metallophosphoesterase [Oligoflexus sp.]HET9236698.1 metallophosphoesterase [Oligoflexus sp.]
MRYFQKFLNVCSLLLLATCGTSQRSTPDQLPDGAAYYFSIFGDSRDGNDIYSVLQNRSVMVGRPLAAIHLGDMISTPKSSEQWPSFVSLTETYFENQRFYPVIGNHDVEDARSYDLFMATFPQLDTPGYEVEKIGDCFCIILNSEDLEVRPGVIGPTQMAWLETQLSSESAQNAPFRIVFVHRPPFPQHHHKDKPLQPTDELHELFKKYKVAAVFAGHEHSYARIEKDGIFYVVSGGAGSPLHADAGLDAAFYHYVQVSYLKPALQVRTIDHMGKVRDDFTIQLSTPSAPRAERIHESRSGL